MNRNQSRPGAACAVAGSVLLLVGTYLHPAAADPNDAVAAFTEYAADDVWIASHLTQLAGFGLITATLLFLAHQLTAVSGSGLSRIAAGGAIASLAAAAALQAVDGVALKTMVDTWSASPAEQKESIFYAAFAVRQVEIGLASILSILSGLTFTVYGAAIVTIHTYPRWLGGFAIAGGVFTAAAGIVTAYEGFSGVAMTISMAASSVLLLWMVTLGVLMWRGGGIRPAIT